MPKNMKIIILNQVSENCIRVFFKLSWQKKDNNEGIDGKNMEI